MGMGQHKPIVSHDDTRNINDNNYESPKQRKHQKVAKQQNNLMPLRENKKGAQQHRAQQHNKQSIVNNESTVASTPPTTSDNHTDPVEVQHHRELFMVAVFGGKDGDESSAGADEGDKMQLYSQSELDHIIFVVRGWGKGIEIWKCEDAELC